MIAWYKKSVEAEKAKPNLEDVDWMKGVCGFCCNK